MMAHAAVVSGPSQFYPIYELNEEKWLSPWIKGHLCALVELVFDWKLLDVVHDEYVGEAFPTVQLKPQLFLNSLD
jgi:hypothetical protein